MIFARCFASIKGSHLKFSLNDSRQSYDMPDMKKLFFLLLKKQFMIRDNILGNQEENEMVEDRCTRLGEVIRDFVLSSLCIWLK